LAIRARVYARKRCLDVLPPEAAERIREHTNGLCIYCGAPGNSFDHLVAVKLGGKTEPGNIVLSCQSCNSRKKDADIDTWLTRVPITTELFEAIALAAQMGVI
ncbi:MAG TPA: HNH endonuclease signature motif containing protein, partial [Ktedonobacteraceae bacterium]